MSKIWFTSDTHFGSDRTLDMSKRPFKTVEEMDNTIISNWNEVVKQEDTVYHLGDFGDFNKAIQLNGNIILITGNYDVKISSQDMLNNGINKVIDEDKYSVWFDNENTDYEFNKYNITMVHEPSKLDMVSAKNCFNLFGHIHKSQMVKKFGLNVGTDCHNFCPIDLDTVLFYKNAIDKFYDEEVFN